MTPNHEIDDPNWINSIEEKLVPLIEQVVNEEYVLAGLTTGIVKDGRVARWRG